MTTKAVEKGAASTEVVVAAAARVVSCWVAALIAFCKVSTAFSCADIARWAQYACTTAVRIAIHATGCCAVPALKLSASGALSSTTCKAAAAVAPRCCLALLLDLGIGEAEAETSALAAPAAETSEVAAAAAEAAAAAAAAVAAAPAAGLLLLPLCGDTATRADACSFRQCAISVLLIIGTALLRGTLKSSDTPCFSIANTSQPQGNNDGAQAATTEPMVALATSLNTIVLGEGAGSVKEKPWTDTNFTITDHGVAGGGSDAARFTERFGSPAYNS